MQTKSEGAMKANEPIALTKCEHIPDVDSWRSQLHLVDDEAFDEKGLESGRIVPLRREDDGTIYAFRCTVCKAAWKIYQNKTCSCEQETA